MRFLIFFLLLIFPSGSFAENLKTEIATLSANVVFMRHALAPGYGDPANFSIDACATQRNLDQRGRDQAKAIGQILLSEKIAFDLILSSEWCRCKDTAEELNLGEWTSFSGLNSFFQGYANKEKTLSKLEKKLASLSSDELVLMVTHQVVISAVTGVSVASGGIVLYNTKTGQSRHIGALAE